MKPLTSLSGLGLALLLPSLVQAETLPALRWFNAELGESALMLLNQQGFQGYRDLATLAPSQWSQPVAGDFNGDGETDLVWRQKNGSEVGVQLYQAGALVWSDSILKASADWLLIGAADLNSDGVDDLVWQNRTSGQLYAHQLKAGRVQAEADLPALPNANWQALALADFNGDGKADLLFRHKTSNEVYVWLLDGFKLKTSLPLYPITPDWQVAAVGDFNGDHLVDLAWQNTRDQEAALMLQVAKAAPSEELRQSSGAVFKVPAGWNIKAAIDVNADNKADLLWTNAAGESALMQLDAGRIMALVDLPQVSDKRWLAVSAYKLGQQVQDSPSGILVSPSGDLSLTQGESLKLNLSGQYRSGKTEANPVGLEISSSDASSVAVSGTTITAKAGTGAVLTLKWQGVQTTVKVTVSAVQPSGVKIALKKPADWSECSIYYWQTQPAVAAVTWPGVAMKQLEENWCVFEFPVGTQSTKLIFSNKGAAQTKDLSRTGAGCYDYASATWTDTCTLPALKPAVTASPAGGSCYEPTSVSIGFSGDKVSSGRYTLTAGTTGTPAINGTSYTNGQKIELCPNSLAIGQSQSLCLYASNGTQAQDANQCYSFTKKAAPSASDFSWDNANIYFVMTDRFVDGDPSNNHAYGRTKDKSGAEYPDYKSNPATFHGGDLKGLTQKLNAGYFTDLGVTALWITAPYEQIHGMVGGNNAKHYGYHGYYAMDYTEVDKNMGTAEELRTFIDTAHAKGIRVIFDIVMNHAGYEDMYTMNEYGFGTLKTGWDSYYYNTADAVFHWQPYNELIDKTNAASWANWWGADWIRTKAMAGYDACGGSEETLCTSDLPDFKTESSTAVDIPPFLKKKWAGAKLTQEQTELNAYFTRTGKPHLVRYHLIKWLTDWVREYGVDGFRVDTAKHVQMSVWKELKDEAVVALREWRKNNPGKSPDNQDLDFWMVGEAWGHGLTKSAFFSNGFDAMINFNFQGAAGNLTSAESLFSQYATALNSDPEYNVLSYISSHDKDLFSRANLQNAGTTLLLLPGAVQIFYGDETARPRGADADHGSRSDMNWASINTAIQSHWQKLGKFRSRHVAVGAGTHQKLSDSPYSFSRIKATDKVVIAFGTGQLNVPVAGVFADGTKLKDAYTDQPITVTGGTASVTAAAQGVVLLELAN